LFNNGIFKNYWFETGPPSFLIDFIKNNVENVEVLFEPSTSISGDFPNFELENIDLTTLLLQTGYLTIKSENVVLGELPTYELTIPNHKVNTSLFTSIIRKFSKQKPTNIPALADKILNSIDNLDNNSLQEALNVLISSFQLFCMVRLKKISTKLTIIFGFCHGLD
jgi:hypothetical protein